MVEVHDIPDIAKQTNLGLALVFLSMCLSLKDAGLW